MYKETKDRVIKYNNQPEIDKEIQNVYDSIKYYPKTHSEKLMKQINRVK